MNLNLPQIQISDYDFEAENKPRYYTPNTDRYIPIRIENDLEKSYHLLAENSRLNSKVLNFSPTKNSISNYSFPYKMPKRKVQHRNRLVLDAPQVQNDFYLNLLDWSDSNILAVGLGNSIHFWNERLKTSTEFKSSTNILDKFSSHITSLKWIDSKTIAIGSDGLIEIWDANSQKCTHKIFDHLGQVTCMDNLGKVLTSGSNISLKIVSHDLRDGNKINEIANYDFTCGLKWSTNGRFLASGGYSGTVCVYDTISGYDKSRLFTKLNEHHSSVKAVSWCPWQNNLLATGGGKFDGKVKFFNVYNGNSVKMIDADAQVSGILWSNEKRQIIYSSNSEEYNLYINSYPSLEIIGELKGHVDRIISLSMSPNESVVSLGADETVRFWDCFKDFSNRNDLSSPISTKNLYKFKNIR